MRQPDSPAAPAASLPASEQRDGEITAAPAVEMPDAAAGPSAAERQTSAELQAAANAGPKAPLRRRFIRSEPRPAASQQAAPAADGASAEVKHRANSVSVSERAASISINGLCILHTMSRSNKRRKCSRSATITTGKSTLNSHWDQESRGV